MDRVTFLLLHFFAKIMLSYQNLPVFFFTETSQYVELNIQFYIACIMIEEKWFYQISTRNLEISLNIEGQTGAI